MAAGDITPPTTDDLAVQTGRDDTFFDDSDWAETCLQQATDLFALATETEQADIIAAPKVDQRMAVTGICFLAEAFYVARQWRDVRQGPFTSETIGSYSYSKASQAIAQGMPTGVGSFDFAVARFSTFTAAESHGTTVFDTDAGTPGMVIYKDGVRVQFFGPAELLPPPQPFGGFDNFTVVRRDPPPDGP